MNTFVEKRLNSNEVSFWDPIPKLKVKTFESTTTKIQVKAVNDKLVTVGADRELFGRLLIALLSLTAGSRQNKPATWVVSAGYFLVFCVFLRQIICSCTGADI